MTKLQKKQLNDVQNVLLDIQNGHAGTNDCMALAYLIDALQGFKDGDIKYFDDNMKHAVQHATIRK
jgi:hypothetical protein